MLIMRKQIKGRPPNNIRRDLCNKDEHINLNSEESEIIYASNLLKGVAGMIVFVSNKVCQELWHIFQTKNIYLF